MMRYQYSKLILFTFEHVKYLALMLVIVACVAKISRHNFHCNGKPDQSGFTVNNKKAFCEHLFVFYCFVCLGLCLVEIHCVHVKTKPGNFLA